MIVTGDVVFDPSLDVSEADRHITEMEAELRETNAEVKCVYLEPEVDRPDSGLEPETRR